MTMQTPDIPKWIDTRYVQNILRKTENDESINISKTTIQPATAKGDNYLSDMYRVSVEFSRVVDGIEIQDEKSLIVKIAPMDVIREEMISTAEVFKIEILMLSNTLPRMNLILTELGMTTLSAQCLFIQKEKPMHLLFEDLGSRGFRMADRQGGLDLDHCLLAVRNLGRFHASSVALKEKDPNALAIYTKGLYHEDYPPSRHAFVNAAVKAVANETRNWNELNPRISEKLLKLSEVVFDKACEVAMYREDDFNVLNHGDFWINNMLFSYDEQQKPIDHIFVDFQICHYGSPAIDLLFFLATSPSDDVRINHRGKLLRKYHESLTSTMVKMKCNTETLSFDDLEKILMRHALFEAIICCVSLPMVLLDKSKAESFDELLTKLEGGYDNPGCRETAYRKIMTRLLPLYDSMGLFDVCNNHSNEAKIDD